MGTDKTVGSLGYTMFVLAMTTGRFSGTWFLNRFGRVSVLRVTCSLAVVGLTLFIFAPNLPLAFVGLFIWGLGASLGFPAGMSAASDDAMKSAVRVSVVSTIGYAAFLGGPPILGFLGEHFGIRNGLIAVLFFIVVSLLLTKQLEQPQSSEKHSEALPPQDQFTGTNPQTGAVPIPTGSLPVVQQSQTDIRTEQK